MVVSKDSDHPKKEKKKRKSGKCKNKAEPSAEPIFEKDSPQPEASRKIPEKCILREKSKTLTDFRRKPPEPGFSEPPRSQWSQSSFRRRINSFIQNSPLLRRSTYWRAASLKNDLNRLSDSLESVKIDEDRILITESGRALVAPAAPSPRAKSAKKSRPKSCDGFNFSGAGPECRMCEAGSENPVERQSGSLWDIPTTRTQNQDGGTMKRSTSLHLTARPWTWISGTILQNPITRTNLGRNEGKTKSPDEEFCIKCGSPLYLFRNGEDGFKNVREKIIEEREKVKINTPLNKDAIKKQKKLKHLSPDREETCRTSNESRSKPQDWTRKLVGSIRRKVSTKKSYSTASNPDFDRHNEEGNSGRVGNPENPQKSKVEVGRRDSAERGSELSPNSGILRRKMSLSATKNHKTLAHQCAIKDETDESELRAKTGADPVSFEKCKIRRKLSFPSGSDPFPRPDGKAPKKKDTTLLNFIFKKQSSFDVKKEATPTPDKPKEKPRKIPDLSFSNPGGPGGSENEVLLVAPPQEPKFHSDIGLNNNELRASFDAGRVGSTSRVVSRSCGQVEMISGDPAVRENFLRATMSIFLAVSPPSSKIQVRSRSLTHIDQIEQSRPNAIFFKEMSSEKNPEQLVVPTNISKHRRQMLSRSEASSSECFTVGFEGLGEDGNDEFVQASKSTILRTALLEICKRKGVDLASSNVFLDANKSPLPCLDIDTSWMGGKHIRIKINDRVTNVKKDQKNSFGPPMPLKKISNYKGTKSGSRTHNVSSEEPSTMEPGPSGKAGKRWSGFFGTCRDTSKMETLIELLDSYTKNGVYEYKEDAFKLESDWKSIVTCAANLEERHSQQQEAIWELLRSEVDYIEMLRVVSHLFIACLVNLQSNQLLLEIDNKKLFGNVEEIYSCNDNFWKKYLMPVVETSRKTGEPFNPELLKEGFMDFPNIFKCYETYCTQQSRCQHYCRERLQQDQDNELFTAYLAWCETQKQCNRLKLLDILVKPMQRLTKYSLLLKAILKHTSNPAHKDSIVNMIKKVDSFVNSVNSTLKQNQDLETMKQLMNKIESYDVIESKDDDLSNLIQKYSTLNLTEDVPGTNHKRSLLFESDVKYKDALTSSKIEVHAFLFTDFLLITKPVKRLGESKVKFKIIRQPFVIDRLITQEIAREPPSLACVYLSDYRTACTAFMLSCSENELLKNWSEAIKKAKMLFSSLKSLQPESQQAQLPNTLSISRQPSGYTNEDASVADNLEESKTTYNLGLWGGRSPRGSSCGSRISSLVHSHSGSMEMTENISSISSVSASRGVSVENNSEVRGSSLSSDDGNTNLAPSPRVELTTSPRVERRETPPVPERRESPILHRPESKSLYRKPNTKSENTLTIQVPHLGQSLPNLNIASSSGGGSSPNPCPPNTLLLAPPKSHGGLLSPSQRGVSYPPPSPPRGSLKRGFAISPRNPPLMKTGHVSMELSRSISVAQAPGEQTEEKKSKTIGLQTNFEEVFVKNEPSPQENKCSHCACNGRGSLLKTNGKKLVRNDKRYHTAGAIDDLKVKRDSSIHKRLSFNNGTKKSATNETIEPPPINKHLSVASVQSSSGFSSAGSSVERLFTKEEGTNEMRPLKFEEILHIINLEDSDNESGKNPAQTDLELFDIKVSKWQKYGFHGGGTENPGNQDSASLNSELPSSNSLIGSASSKFNGVESKKSVLTSRKFVSTAESIHFLTVSVIALQLENILRMTSHKSLEEDRKKKKRRRTL